jgi:hypothetical protein
MRGEETEIKVIIKTEREGVRGREMGRGGGREREREMKRGTETKLKLRRMGKERETE